MISETYSLSSHRSAEEHGSGDRETDGNGHRATTATAETAIEKQ